MSAVSNRKFPYFKLYINNLSNIAPNDKKLMSMNKELNFSRYDTGFVMESTANGITVGFIATKDGIYARFIPNSDGEQIIKSIASFT